MIALSPFGLRISWQRNVCAISTVQLPKRLAQENLCLIMRKPVFVVSDKVQHKPGCTVTEDG